MLAAIAFLANFVGLLCYVNWSFYGYTHRTGPSWQVYLATGLLAFGIAAGIAWFGNAILGLRQRTTETKGAGAGIVTGIFLLLLLVPATFCFMFAVPDSIKALNKPSLQDLVDMAP